MKNDILHYYGLDAQELLESDFGYQFYIDYDKYILYRTSKSDSLMTEVDTFLSKTPNKYYKIIPAIDGKRVCKIENVSYVLLKVTTPLNEEISADTIMANSIPVFNSLSSLDRSNWAFLWESKVDYLEYQVLELAGDYSIVKSTFNYYVGLSENAIEYYRAINRENTHLVLSQKRIYCPNIAKDYYNPTTIVVDYRVRSLAEYIKSYFFNSDNTKEADRLIHKDFGLIIVNTISCLHDSYIHHTISMRSPI